MRGKGKFLEMPLKENIVVYAASALHFCLLGNRFKELVKQRAKRNDDFFVEIPAIIQSPQFTIVRFVNLKMSLTI